MESLPGQGLVAVFPVEQDLTLLGQVDVTRQAELQLHRSDQVGVSSIDGSLEELLGVLVVDHLRHTGCCLTAHTHQMGFVTCLAAAEDHARTLSLSKAMITMKGCQMSKSESQSTTA